MRLKKITLLVFVLAITMVILPQARGFGLYGTSGKLGLSIPTESGLNNGFLFGGNGIFTLPKENLYLVGDFYYTSWGIEGFSSLSTSDVSISSSIRYEFPTGSFNPYIGVGLGIHIFSISLEYSYIDPWTGQTISKSESDSETDFGLHFLGGASMPVSANLDAFGELRFDLVIGDGYTNIFSLAAGVTYKFGQSNDI